MIRQSNPVLYFLLGGTSALAGLLEARLRRYMDGFAVIPVPKEGAAADAQWFSEAVNNVRPLFYQHQFASPGVIRVNFILTADDAAFELAVLRGFTERYVSPLYPSGVLTDIHCLLDDVALNTKNAALDKLAGAEDARVYLFSNVGSGQTMVDESRFINTLSLLTLFKDAEPPVISDRADAFRYMEFNFTDSCYTRAGQFLTAGYASLSLPRETLRDFLVLCLLNLDRDEVFPAEHPVEDLEDYTSPVEDAVFEKSKTDYTLGLAARELPAKDLANMTNSGLIRLFGARLEKIVEAEALVFDSPAVLPAEGSVYHLLRVSGEGGPWQNGIRAAIHENNDEIQSAEKSLKNWLAQKPSTKAFRPLSVLVKQDLRPYHAAGEYMGRLFTLKLLHKREALLQETFAKIEAFNSEWHARLPLLEARVQALSPAETAINAQFALFSKDAAGYFKRKFDRFAQREKDALYGLTRGMASALQKNEFPVFMERVKDYTERNILTAPEFNQPIMAMLTEMADESPVGEPPQGRLSEWIGLNKRYHVQLKTGFEGLYSEVNVFMPACRAAELKQDYERGRERVNLFTDESAEKVEVLYHAGAFATDDLYFKGLYE